MVGNKDGSNPSPKNLKEPKECGEPATASSITTQKRTKVTKIFNPSSSNLEQFIPNQLPAATNSFYCLPLFSSNPTGLQTTQDARFYQISAAFPKFSNKGKDLILQYSVKNEQNLDCGGGYVKLLPEPLDQEKFNGDSTYKYVCLDLFIDDDDDMFFPLFDEWMNPIVIFLYIYFYPI